MSFNICFLQTLKTDVKPRKISLNHSENFNYRVWLTRYGHAKYLSQHDTALILEQAIRRSQLPVGLAGQFNPRMKISFYASCPVGVACHGDPIDIIFTQPQDCSTLQNILQHNLPTGFGIAKVENFERRNKYWLKLQYQIRVNQIITAEKIQALFERNEIWIFRTHNAKRVNIRPYLLEYHINTIEDSSFYILEMTTRMDTTGSVSVWEILESLGIPLNDTVMLHITRTSVTLIPIEIIDTKSSPSA